MGCSSCSSTANKSGVWRWIGNNTIKAFPTRGCKQGFDFSNSYYEIHHGGVSAIVHESDFGAPFSIGENQFQINGSLLSSQIFALQEGAFGLEIDLVLVDRCNKLYYGSFFRTLRAVLPVAPMARSLEPAPLPEEIAAAGHDAMDTPSETKSKRRKKKVSGMVLDVPDNEEPKEYEESGVIPEPESEDVENA